ncbi:translocation protein [Paecilomyces variotii No. 5]|uniref:Translocation protein n=1 Tax=Byssochlamys spectabilis (strain No. 5 / NBRC 109023) TaxID=1356009 RepID=V5HT39_BYSSN|nr:translocation protein [Paecilomyces variotii No. 5]
MVDWLSLAVPVAYLGILIGSLATFSSLYRKRKAVKATSLAPWFPPHLQRDIYYSLLHLEPPASGKEKEKKAPPVPETVLKAALLRRAAEDINRVMAIRNQKQALAMLLQRGSVGDDLWNRFSRAEKEMEDEANAYVPGWGQTIFQSANEMINNEAFRRRIQEMQSSTKDEREWWDRKKATIQEGFMKELDQEAASKSGSRPTTSSAQTTSATKNPEFVPSATGSDDDAVLVESGGPAAPETASPESPKKKKKGKK